MGHDCHEDATCHNVNPKFACRCNDGFQGDGYNCTGELIENRQECQLTGVKVKAIQSMAVNQ